MGDDIQEIDLRQYIRILLKWRWVIIAITAASMLTSGVLSYLVISPVYEAKVTLLITEGERKQVTAGDEGLQSVVNAISRLPEMTINTYIGQIKSLYFLERVIKAAQLDNISPSELAGLVKATTVKDTNLIDVTVSNTDPVMAAHIANAISQEFLAFISENAHRRMDNSIKFLEDQMQSVSTELEFTTRELNSLKAGRRSARYLDEEINSRTASLAEYRSAIIRAKVDRDLLQTGVTKIVEALASAQVEAESPNTANTGNTENLPAEVAQPKPSDQYQTLRSLLEQRQISLAEKEAQIRGYEAYIAGIEKEMSALQAEYTEKRAAEDRLEKKVAQLESTAALLSDRLLQAQMARSMNLGEANISIVSPALVPTAPVRPRKQLNIAVAAVLGVMIGIGLTFILEYMDNTIKNADDVRRVLDLPTLGSIPVITGKM